MRRKRRQRTGASSSTNSFRNLGGMPSGPQALFVFKERKGLEGMKPSHNSNLQTISIAGWPKSATRRAEQVVSLTKWPKSSARQAKWEKSAASQAVDGQSRSEECLEDWKDFEQGGVRTVRREVPKPRTLALSLQCSHGSLTGEGADDLEM